MEKFWTTIKEHPYLAGIGGFIVLMFILYELGWFGSKSSTATTADPTLSNYYAAESAAQQSGNQLAMVSDAYNAQTQIAGIGAANNQVVNWQNVVGATDLGIQQNALDSTLNSQNIAGASTINSQNIAGSYANNQLLAELEGYVTATNAGSNNYIAGINGAETGAREVFGSNLFNQNYQLLQDTAAIATNPAGTPTTQLQTDLGTPPSTSSPYTVGTFTPSSVMPAGTLLIGPPASATVL